MSLQDLANSANKSLKQNSTAIFTGMSIAGVISTAYLTARATLKAAKIIEELEATGGTAGDPKQKMKEDIKATWTLYIPAAISGGVTIGCIIGSSKAHANRTAAAVMAYSLTEKAYAEHRDKVAELFNENKAAKVRAALAQDHVARTPVPTHLVDKAAADNERIASSTEVVVLGRGQVRCFERLTGRYFLSDMESLKAAMNEINAELNRNNYVALDDFYDLVDLARTSYSGKVGWSGEEFLQLDFSSVICDDNQPALAFEYSYLKPLVGFVPD